MPNLEIETGDWGEEPDDFVEIDSATSSSDESWEHVEGADATVGDADLDADDSNTLTPAEQQGLVDEFPALDGILSEIDGGPPEAAMLDELAARTSWRGSGASPSSPRRRPPSCSRRTRSRTRSRPRTSRSRRSRAPRPPRRAAAAATRRS